MDRFLVRAIHSVLFYLICDRYPADYQMWFCFSVVTYKGIFHIHTHTHPFFFFSDLVGVPEVFFPLRFVVSVLEGCPQTTRTQFVYKVLGTVPSPRWPSASEPRAQDYENPIPFPCAGTTQVIGIVKPILYFRVTWQVNPVLDKGIIYQAN